MNISIRRGEKKPIADLREEMWKLDEKLDEVKTRLNSMAKILGVAFSHDGYEAFRVVKDDEKTPK